METIERILRFRSFNRGVLLVLLTFLVKLNSFSQNLYWRATPSNNLASNVGNWETAPGNNIAPGSALSASNNLFFPVNSTIMAVNLNGISAGSITVSSAGAYNFTGTGSFSGSITANANAFFTGATVNMVGTNVKTINCDPNVNTTTTYFGTLNCNQGTVNLIHNLIFINGLSISASFNSNGRKISSVSRGLTLIASSGNTINLSNSFISVSSLAYYNAVGFTGVYSGTRVSLSGTGILGVGNPDCLQLRGSGPAVSMQSITFAGGNDYQEVERGSNLGGYYDINLDTLIIDSREVNNLLFSGGNWNLNTLKFARTSNLSLNGTISFSNLITPSTCLGVSTINTSTVNTLSAISNSAINFYAVNFTGVGYTGAIENNIIGNTGTAVSWTLPAPASQTFWWVGGVGDWLDPTQWSVVGSGGAPQLATSCVPTLLDDVVFDANSFTAVGQTVNTMAGLVSGFALCRNMTVTDPANEGKFNGSITIAGNADFSGTIGVNAVNSIRMVGKAVHTLQSGTTTYSGNVTFNGSGNFSLVDNVTCSLTFSVLSGNFNANGKTITSNRWYSNGTLTRSINLNNSNLYITNESIISNVNLTSFSAVNSLITYTGTTAFATFQGSSLTQYPAPNTILPIVQLNDVVFNGIAILSISMIGSGTPIQDFRFNNITCNDFGTFYDAGFIVNNLNLTGSKGYFFNRGSTYTILTGINTLGGICGELISIQSTTVGLQTNLFKASLPFTITNAVIRDVIATGAALTVNNGVNLGNLINVTVNPGVPRNFYWVNGTGNWSDGIGHWSIGTSGGNPAITNPGGCIPTANDNVFFDGFSFSGMGQTVTLNVDGNCKNMTWDAGAAAFAPVFSGILILNVYGSYVLSTGMVHNHTGVSYFYGTSTAVNGQIINTDDVLIQTQIRLVGGGRYDIRHDISSTGTSSRLYLYSGRLYSNGHEIFIGAVGLTNLGLANNFADISNSIIKISQPGLSQGSLGAGSWSSQHFNSAAFIATNSTIICSGGQLIISNFASTPVDYHNVICSSTSNCTITQSSGSTLIRFNKVEMQGANSLLNSNHTIDTLIYAASSVNKLGIGYNYIVNDTLIAFGSPCNPLRIESSVAGTPVSFTNNACNTEIKYGAIKDINANLATGCSASDYLVYGSNNGGNSNWTFLPYASISGLGSDTTFYCTGAPYVLTTGNIGTTSASYLWSDGTTGTTLPIYQSGTYTLSTTFESGCTINNTITAIVLDTVAPTISGCNDTTFYLNNSCQFVVPDFESTISITDDCSASINIDYSQVPAVGTILSGQGIRIVKLYAEDAYGNIDSCSFNMSLLDNLPPTVICQNFTGALNASGTLTITPATINNGSSDACGITSMTVFPNNFNCSNLGANTVTLTVTDVNGNSSSCTSTVTVVDNVPPTVHCQNFTANLNAAGIASITPANINNGSTDNCTIASMTVSPNSFTCANLGNNTVTLTVTDGSGNVSTCTSTVTVVDVIPPTVACQNLTVNLDVLGNASITAADINNGSTDNCGITSMSVSPMTFDCSNVGANTVTLTVTDGSGNVSTCTATVTVVDNILPVAICQNYTVALNASGTALITPANINNGSNDACGIASMTVFPNNFTCSNLGANTVTLTVTDVNGNASVCTSTVTVIDTIEPTVHCQNFTANLNAAGIASITPANINNGSTDNCTIASMTVSPNSFTCANLGNNTVTLTVTDGSGNVSTCTSTVTVIDVVPPTAVCQNFTVNLDASGNASITTADIDNGSTDNCAIASISVSPNTFDCPNVGTNTVTLTVTDGSGNVSTCNAMVTVVDNIPPIAICQNFTVALDASGNASITPSNINNGSTDICGISTITVSPNSFNCSNIGANTVTMTVIDVNGNVSTCTSTVIVEDNMNPQIISCISDTTVATTGGLCDAIVPDFTSNSQLVVTDNCSTQNIDITISQFPLAGSLVTANTIVWMYATDGSGNVDSCSFLMSIEDQTNPIIVNCISDSTLVLGQNCDVILPDFTGSTQLIVTDNCSQQGIDITITQSISAGTLITADTVIWIYASDVAGNVDSCSFNVFVIDTIAPQINCIGDQDIAVDDNCEFALPDYTSFGIIVTDNCSTAGLNLTVSQKPAPGILLSKQTIVWLFAIDNWGNVDSCSFTVNPSDCELIFYESFSPGDKDGKNDYFVIEGIERFPNSRLIVFNRWGEAVFESDNYLNEWDGRSQSRYNVGGDLLPDGVYYYILELGNSDASIDNTYTGFVYLKR